VLDQNDCVVPDDVERFLLQENSEGQCDEQLRDDNDTRRQEAVADPAGTGQPAMQ